MIVAPVDPRFARWFGRQVVMHARAEEDVFVQQVRKQELEKWERIKTGIKKFCFDVAPSTTVQAIGLLWKYALFFTSLFWFAIGFWFHTFLMLMFAILPFLLLAPVVSLSCRYGNQTIDVCNAIDYNFTVPITFDGGKRHFITLNASTVYAAQECLRLWGDIIDWVLWEMLPNYELAQHYFLFHFPDKATMCERLSGYDLFGFL